jgi:phosphoribosyl-ATP pyrophosphohydrolase/phosphoribosyl-AMP cyclohydrolase
MYDSLDIEELSFGPGGLLPAVAQDASTGEVLMLAWMNREALRKTMESGMAHYYSRSRQRLWLKGETSGHFQSVVRILRDCDDDSLLLLVEQTGAACHTGRRSCFFRELDGRDALSPRFADKSSEDVLSELQEVIEGRRANPKEGSYTSYLFDKGIDKILKKVGEESSEIIIAAKNPSQTDLTGEIADMMFHVSVLLAQRGLSWRDVCAELERRRKK